MIAMPTARRLILTAFIAVVVLGPAPAAWATTPADAQAELTETQAQLAQARARIAAARRSKASLDSQIARLDGRLAVIDDRLTRLDGRIADVEGELSDTRKKLEVLRQQLRLKRAQLQKAEDRLQLQLDYFGQRVVLSYKSDDLSYIDVILAASSFEDFVSRMRVVRDLIGGDNDYVAQLEATRDEVAREKRAIAVKEAAVDEAVAQLQGQIDQLAELRAVQAAEQQAAAAARQEKGGALAAVAADLEELERQEDALLAQSATLASIIQGEQGGGNGTGAMVWPVSGTVTSGYGWRIHPILKTRRLHTGIDIGASYGTAIVAADSGRVIYSTWVGGYGNTIAIDHGRGISTLYAHQSSLAVGYGATVARGQVIGYVGSTGLSTGPHLHFEVRVNGSPVDPMGYLP
jgi:murein DD-endopeptidase MepM/ murein hydrolase activator NlpD